MSIQSKRSCAMCGEKLTLGKQGRHRRFCSIKCGNIYHNRKYAAKSLLHVGKVICPQCGVVFERSEKSKRECCSRTCSHKWNRRDEIDDIRCEAVKQKALDNPGDFQAWVLKLYDAGYNRGAIAVALNLSLRTFCCWIERHNKENKFGIKPENKMYQRNYGNAQTAEEWLLMLQNNRESISFDKDIIPEIENRQIYLVCGATVGGKGADCLCADIYAKLRMNPFSGDVFAYCSKRRDNIRYIYWDGNGFNTISRRKEIGGYSWPPSKFGTVLSVTNQDFTFILRNDKKFSSSSVISWNSLNI